MNTLNQQRAQEVRDQLLTFTAADATPVTDFAVAPAYGLIAHFPAEINERIHNLSAQLQARFPEQYYYSPQQYHFTVVPIPHSFEPEKIIDIFSPILQGWRLPVRIQGCGVNRFQASVVLYPQEETLVSVRKKLRDALGTPQQAFTDHRVVWDELLWANFMRFTTKPSDELIAFLQAHANEPIGDFVIDRFELYEVSNKTLDAASSKLLYTFEASEK